ncbi:hypothetical protein QA802_32385 [Streptomyces sp. B21-105]|uniref:hypothetical protein n=1 Tax=Streptomyces sp. B21-105 TaxID=3039417 RepID=UPI002FF22B0C
MPTEHACQSAAELAAEHLDALRPFLQSGHPHGEDGGGIGDWPLGASALLVVLAGLQADRPGEQALWHAHAGDRIREALGLPAARTEQFPARRQPRGWDALAVVQHKAQELLTDLSDGCGPGRSGALSGRLARVEDALAGALRRMAVPEEASTRCAAGLAEAAGSLFGLRPSSPPAVPPHPTTPPLPATPPVANPALPPDLTARILF